MQIDLDALRTCEACGCVYDKDYAKKNEQGFKMCPACGTSETYVRSYKEERHE